MNTEVLTIGETLVVVRCHGRLSVGGQASVSVAGAESNVAIGLARLDHTVRWLGVVGDDEPGELVLRTLRAEAVEVAGVRTDPTAPTGLLLSEQRLPGLGRVRYYRARSAGSGLAPPDVTRAFEPAPGLRLLHVTGITPALGDGPAAAVTTAVTAARAAGAAVCLDVNYRSRLWPRQAAAAALRPLLPQVDIVVASGDELDLVASGAAEPEQVAGLLAAGVSEVVVKRGAAGATAYTTAGEVSVPARAVPVVDVIGAGDAFVAGYLSARLDGLDVAARLGRAATTAAFVVASLGDWEGLPGRAELDLLDDAQGTVR